MGYAVTIDRRTESERELQCFYCGRDIVHIPCQNKKPRPVHAKTKDHVIPKCIGGQDVVFCCHGCNLEKGHLTLEEYRLVLAYRRGLLNIQIPYTFFGETQCPVAMAASGAESGQ